MPDSGWDLAREEEREGDVIGFVRLGGMADPKDRERPSSLPSLVPSLLVRSLVGRAKKVAE